MMSYDLRIHEEKYPNLMAKVENHEEGGTFALGGTTDAELNITYNYSKIFNFRGLNGKSCKECIEWLEPIVKILGTDRSEDYWESTNGNVGYCLSVILSWCKQHPTGFISIH